MFASVIDQRVPFGQKKLLALRVEFRDPRERERASIGRNGLSEKRIALLAIPCRLPVANVQDHFDPEAFDPGAVKFDDPKKRWKKAFER